MASTKTHGTFVADILGKPLKNGVSGVAPESTIFLCDVSDSNGVIYTSALVRAIKDATELNVDIISISLGTNTYDAELERVVRLASKKGILVFAASGNCSCRNYEFPSSCEDAISVASMDKDRNPSKFNTRNDSVSVFAPGQNILVPGRTLRLSGTSFAVPFASGVAALELEKAVLAGRKRPNREEIIGHLRDLFGHNCEIHSYSNDVCTGRFAGGSFLPPSKTEYYLWPILLTLLFYIVWNYKA